MLCLLFTCSSIVYIWKSYHSSWTWPITCVGIHHTGFCLSCDEIKGVFSYGKMFQFRDILILQWIVHVRILNMLWSLISWRVF